jgi:hypothetical protein
LRWRNRTSPCPDYYDESIFAGLAKDFITGQHRRHTPGFELAYFFCRQNKNHADITIISLDWGFNEQLAFLTDAPKLVEPFWALQRNSLPFA